MQEKSDKKKSNLTNGLMQKSSSSQLKAGEHMKEVRQLKKRVNEEISEIFHGRREMVKYSSPPKVRVIEAEEKIHEEFKLSIVE